MSANIWALQQHSFGKSPISKSGVLTISGFGVRVRMQHGHLEIEDGVGPDRRRLRLARVGHRLSDSFAFLRMVSSHYRR